MKRVGGTEVAHEPMSHELPRAHITASITNAPAKGIGLVEANLLKVETNEEALGVYRQPLDTHRAVKVLINTCVMCERASGQFGDVQQRRAIQRNEGPHGRMHRPALWQFRERLGSHGHRAP